MRVRMKDIARDLGVSVVTVSKVLRNHGDIGEETRQRVLQRIKELNYKPNLTARALVTGRSYTVGLIVPDLLHAFFAHVAKALSGRLRKDGYTLIIASSEDNPDIEEQEIENLLSRNVDALLIASAQRNSHRVEALTSMGRPFALLDRSFDGFEANLVGTDNVRAGALATGHLIEQGCRRVAHIQGPDVSTSTGRAAGYRRAMAAAGRTVLPEYVVSLATSADDRGESEGYQAMKQLLGVDPAPDGVFCYNDTVAVGAMKAALEAGLRIPDDIAIAGCGNLHYSDFLRVPLTSVDQQCEELGARAGDVVLGLIQSDGASAPARLLVEPKLIVRTSSLRKLPNS